MDKTSSKITKEIEISPEILSEIQKEVKDIFGFKEKIKELLEKKVTEILEVILVGAISLDASDLHIEPEENQAKIRVRIDGMLQDVVLFEPKIYKALLSRIKLLSGIKLNISDRPQDGRFSILLSKDLESPEEISLQIEIRSSTLPAEHGESIVLRILNPKNLIEIEALGLREDLLKIFEKEIKKPNGMIIVTGPTGSGKTTTLYAFLKKIQAPEIKIITIEDPIEYHLKGISQTQVDAKKGYDFASGLKSIVRQDPDTILVGEVRDLETVEIALQSALTGHLVLTTLHTNDAAGTVARLINLGAKASNIGPAVNLAVAQRLVRKVCKKCAKLEKIPTPVLNKIKKALKGIPKEAKFSKQAELAKLNPELKVFQPKGCKQCNSTGYQGRIAIFEAFLIDDEIERFILKNPSIADLREEAIKKGMVTMYQDGLMKALEGITTVEEVERVTGE
ncbi:GspE/PulE family protein [Patescibacteria group bacterium]|nr:GspE/PulE family protein [Patescibacteria group bacterium]